jgi:hypothetical protein
MRAREFGRRVAVICGSSAMAPTAATAANLKILQPA